MFGWDHYNKYPYIWLEAPSSGPSLSPYHYARKLHMKMIHHRLSRVHKDMWSFTLWLVYDLAVIVLRFIAVRYNRYNREFKTQAEEEY